MILILKSTNYKKSLNPTDIWIFFGKENEKSFDFNESSGGARASASRPFGICAVSLSATLANINSSRFISIK
jgi:hypothetical protein